MVTEKGLGLEEFPPLNSQLALHTGEKGGKGVLITVEDRANEDANDDVGVTKQVPVAMSNGKPKLSDVVNKSSSILPSSSIDLLYRPPSMVDGNLSASLKLSDISAQISECSDFVVGGFVGPRLPFHQVKRTIEKAWKIKGNLTMTIHGARAFILKFSLDEDRIKALEHGPVFVSSNPFFVRAWEPYIEKELENIKTVPIWVIFRGVPVHFFNPVGLSFIASVIGKPLLLDGPTAAKTRMTYARVCVEVNPKSELKSSIPVLVDGKLMFTVDVDYVWKPPQCSSCSTFCHNENSCPNKKHNHVPVMKYRPKEKVGIIVDSSSLVQPSRDMQLELGPEHDWQPVNHNRKSLKAGLEVHSHVVDKSALQVNEAASTTSLDPSIPPGFEGHNRFHGLEEEEEVATSKLEVENSEISIHKPSSSEPILLSNRKVSSKSKSTGLFPNGTLNTKKSSKSLDDSNIISANKLVDYGTEWGLSFPSSKKKCRDMCDFVVKGHKGLTLEEIDEFPS